MRTTAITISSQGSACELNICPGRCEEVDIEAKSFRLYRRCPKRCYHHKFIRVPELIENDLPLHVRDSGMLGWIQGQAKHTVRLIVAKQSMARPKKYKTSKNGTTTGTGFAEAIDVSHPPDMRLCAGLNPRNVFQVKTAAHVVFCEEEFWIHG